MPSMCLLLMYEWEYTGNKYGTTKLHACILQNPGTEAYIEGTATEE
jgi:hypothetical protein